MAEEVVIAKTRRPDVIFLVFTLADDTIVIYHFVVKEYNPDGSVRMHRIPTPDNIEITIKKTNYGQPVKSWRYAGPDIYEPVKNDTTYKAAWRDGGSRIVHDIDHVRRIATNNLRRFRKAQFAQMDAAWARAMDAGKQAEANMIGAVRRKLRDCPARLMADAATCTTMEEVHSHYVRISEDNAAEVAAASKI